MFLQILFANLKINSGFHIAQNLPFSCGRNRQQSSQENSPGQ